MLTDYGRHKPDHVCVLQVDETGATALHYAAAGGHEAVCKLLLKHGAAVDIQDEVSSLRQAHDLSMSTV